MRRKNILKSHILASDIFKTRFRHSRRSSASSDEGDNFSIRVAYAEPDTMNEDTPATLIGKSVYTKGTIILFNSICPMLGLNTLLVASIDEVNGIQELYRPAPSDFTGIGGFLQLDELKSFYEARLGSEGGYPNIVNAIKYEAWP